MHNKPAADAQERLVFAIQQVAADVSQMMTVPPHKVPMKDPVGQQIVGMMLVLGRLYWAITGQDFRNMDPKTLLHWALSLKKNETIIIL